MASTLKRPRPPQQEEDHELVKLARRRVEETRLLIAARGKKEQELAKARVKLAQAEKLLAQCRDQKVAAALRHDGDASVLGGNASQTPAKKSPAAATAAAAASPSVQPSKSAAKSSSKSQQNSSKRASEEKTKKGKGGAAQRENVDLISIIKSQTKPAKLDVAFPIYVNIHHKRKPRSLVLSPAIDHLCATSALDGVVNFWQITQDRGFGLNLSHHVDCMSPGKRWPEDLAWHPHGKSLFAVYTADGGPQIGIIDTSKAKSELKPKFLGDKPHEQGIIKTIEFMPWSNGSQFVTGGSDHGVVLWTETENAWQPELLHRKLHSSAVTGVGGIPNKKLIISSGLDRRVFAIDPSQGTTPKFAHQLESKALGVAPNPVDCNLVMVQTGTPGQQLRLFDIRVQGPELHCFGWKQHSSDAQSGYVSQSWSPDGLYCASGSTDPKIHVFDIRYNSKEPMQTLDAHQKRVFKAAWHPNLPLLLSISSDLRIGMHKIIK